MDPHRISTCFHQNYTIFKITLKTRLIKKLNKEKGKTKIVLPLKA